MAATIKITLLDPGFLVGIRGIDILLDDKPMKPIKFGSSETIECTPGGHTIRLRLKGIFNIIRNSNEVKLNLSDSDEIKFIARYNRIWGNIRISQLR